MAEGKADAVARSGVEHSGFIGRIGHSVLMGGDAADVVFRACAEVHGYVITRRNGVGLFALDGAEGSCVVAVGQRDVGAAVSTCKGAAWVRSGAIHDLRLSFRNGCRRVEAVSDHRRGIAPANKAAAIARIACGKQLAVKYAAADGGLRTGGIALLSYETANSTVAVHAADNDSADAAVFDCGIAEAVAHEAGGMLLRSGNRTIDGKIADRGIFDGGKGRSLVLVTENVDRQRAAVAVKRPFEAVGHLGDRLSGVIEVVGQLHGFAAEGVGGKPIAEHIPAGGGMNNVYVALHREIVAIEFKGRGNCYVCGRHGEGIVGVVYLRRVVAVKLYAFNLVADIRRDCQGHGAVCRRESLIRRHSTVLDAAIDGDGIGVQCGLQLHVFDGVFLRVGQCAAVACTVGVLEVLAVGNGDAANVLGSLDAVLFRVFPVQRGVPGNLFHVRDAAVEGEVSVHAGIEPSREMDLASVDGQIAVDRAVVIAYAALQLAAVYGDAAHIIGHADAAKGAGILLLSPNYQVGTAAAGGIDGRVRQVEGRSVAKNDVDINTVAAGHQIQAAAAGHFSAHGIPAGIQAHRAVTGDPLCNDRFRAAVQVNVAENVVLEGGRHSHVVRGHGKAAGIARAAHFHVKVVVLHSEGVQNFSRFGLDGQGDCLIFHAIGCAVVGNLHPVAAGSHAAAGHADWKHKLTQSSCSSIASANRRERVAVIVTV